MNYDLIVIGAGSGGVRAARKAAETGARVAVIEASDLGGTCVNLGCVPKKLMMYAAQFGEYSRLATDSGWNAVPRVHDWATFLARKNAEISRLNDIYQNLLYKAGVEIIRGFGRLIRPHVVQVGDQEYSARRVLLATGTTPHMPDIPGIEYCINSDDLFHLPAMPARIIVVGGGYIATEFAGILHGLGVQVTQLYRGSLFLRGFDTEIRRSLARQMRSRGIELHFDTDVAAIEKQSQSLCLRTTSGEILEADAILYATGRTPLTAELGLDAVGIATDAKGYIVVDDCYQTSLQDHYALGDLIGRVGLTPVAIREAMHLVRYLFGDGTKPNIDYAMIPSAVFSSPAIATVGPTTEQLDAQGVDYQVFETSFTPMQYSFAASEQRNLFRLMVDCTTHRVLAAHLLGQDAPEIMQTLAVAIKAGATKTDFDAVIGIHPTGAEELVTLG